MKFVITLLLLTLTPAITCAGEKAKITLSDTDMSSTGGMSRPEGISIKFSQGMFNDDPITNVDKIKAMKKLIDFYEFLAKYKIDLNKQITATYTNKKLSEVIKELMPGAPIKFDKVDPNVTVESFKITKASLKKVLKHLERSSATYIHYNKSGVHITSKPN